jgi:hypothetical protein
VPPCCAGTASKKRLSDPRETQTGMTGRSDSSTYCRIIAVTKSCATGTLSLIFPLPHVPFLWPASLAPPPVSFSLLSMRVECSFYQGLYRRFSPSCRMGT